MRLNYGPWDRLNNNEPLLPEQGPMPPGLNCYPEDMTNEEFEQTAQKDPELKGPFTMVRRTADGKLEAIPYHVFFNDYMRRASSKLREASEIANDLNFSRFLKLRGEALQTDSYFESDMAWMEVKESNLELLIGPMETSMERRYWRKAAYAGNVMVKDESWTQKLGKYIPMLNDLQQELPFPKAYRDDQPGLDTQLGVYDVVYLSGYDAQTLPIGVAWPDDEIVQSRKGIRVLQLRNLMRAKFEKLTRPLAQALLAQADFDILHFNANFSFIMFHELGHGLGCKNTINGKGTVKEALGEYYYVVEECKADLMSLVLLSKLFEWGEIAESELLGGYISSLVKVFRNHSGRQDLIRLNYFLDMGAYIRDPRRRRYQVDPETLRDAAVSLLNELIRLQGDGNFVGAKELIEQYANARADFSEDFERSMTSLHAEEIRIIEYPNLVL
jgi:hypothetical protein